MAFSPNRYIRLYLLSSTHLSFEDCLELLLEEDKSHTPEQRK